jgi:3-methyladenine DNA glycosylase/8-oxoguanine DNA glycosylase
MHTPQTRTWRPPHPVDVVATLHTYRHGPYDPTFALEAGDAGAVWRTSRPADGPATVRVDVHPSTGEVVGTAWGPGADAALEALPAWLGAEDDPGGFRPDDPALRHALNRAPGLVIGRTGLVMEALVPAVLEQKVTSLEAHRGWTDLLRRFGEPAPGPAPAGMRVVPPARVWAEIPSWEWHRAGVGPQRSRTIVRAARVAARLEEAAGMASVDADRRLRAVPGIGVWTSAEVRQRVLGDADAVSVGDYSLPHAISYALAGEERGTDARMLELLEPYAGHRHRVCVLVRRTMPRPPRRAPKAPIRDYRRM